MVHPDRRGSSSTQQLRRQLYGLILLATSLTARAADTGESRLQDAAPADTPIIQNTDIKRLSTHALLARLIEMRSANQWGIASGMEITSSSIALDNAYVREDHILTVPHYRGDDIDILRKGLGLDIALPEKGTLHINLYGGRDGISRGKHWRFNPADVALPDAGGGRWSLGGTLELSRADRQSRRQLMFVPQLLLNIDQFASVPGRMQLAMMYGPWRGTVSGLSEDAGVTPQILLKWSY
ncbi:MAG TPA: hypothetical protein VN046_09185 [Stenotrophobium sp.]|nr:hypothetical protein [Stenotrophobium sp.]